MEAVGRKLRVEDAAKIAPGTMIVVVRAEIGPDGSWLVNDVGDSAATIELTGAFRLKIKSEFPVPVSAISPGHDAADVSLSTCAVDLDLFLAKRLR